MLNTPYVFINQDGSNKFYILPAETPYLATESIIALNDDEATAFDAPDIQQGLKLIALTPQLSALFIAMSNTPKSDLGPDLDGFDTYGFIDTDAFIRKLSSMFADANYTNAIFHLDTPYDNAVVNALISEGNPILWSEHDDRVTDKVYLIGPNNLGLLVLFVITLGKGSNGKMEVTGADRYIYNIDTIKSVVDYFHSQIADTDAQSSKGELQ